MMTSLRWLLCLFAYVLTLPGLCNAEQWDRFAKLVEESDYIAQHQELIRNKKTVVGHRRVQVYWRAKAGQSVNLLANGKASWSMADVDRGKDELVTSFVFHGRGQHLVTIVPKNGMIQYPGETADIHPKFGLGEYEIACSPIEFHQILVDAAKLKKAGKAIAGTLDLNVFGKIKKAGG